MKINSLSINEFSFISLLVVPNFDTKGLLSENVPSCLWHYDGLELELGQPRRNYGVEITCEEQCLAEAVEY